MPSRDDYLCRRLARRCRDHARDERRQRGHDLPEGVKAIGDVLPEVMLAIIERAEAWRRFEDRKEITPATPEESA